jgi:MYXO-CTERM domain-containing protein
VRGPLLSRLASPLLLSLSTLLGTPPARADGSFPEPQQILLPADRPEQIILATNFGLILSDDGGSTWLFSCEQALNAYAGQYLLAAQGSRIFALTGAGLVHSDDDSCSWRAAGGTLSDVLPYALAVDPSNAKRVYAIGVLREDLHAGESIYVSDDGGLTFGKPVFTAPARSALLTVLVAPSRTTRLFATMFSTPENHPILLHSDDSGEHWEVAANLVESLGEDPFELLAIDANDENKLYVRILGASAETLATSHDGGLSFVQSVSIPGKLKAFLKLASGTILVGGTAGTEARSYRSTDGAQSFEPWAEAPHVHALAERNGKLYVAAENFWDGYVIAESEDEGAHLRPLTAFNQVLGVKSCASELCAESCAYYAGIDLWPEAVCAAAPNPTQASDPTFSGAGADAKAGDQDLRGPPALGAAEPPLVDETASATGLRGSGGGCACQLVGNRPATSWVTLLLAVGMLAAARRSSSLTRTRDSVQNRRSPGPVHRTAPHRRRETPRCFRPGERPCSSTARASC